MWPLRSLNCSGRKIGAGGGGRLGRGGERGTLTTNNKISHNDKCYERIKPQKVTEALGV